MDNCTIADIQDTIINYFDKHPCLHESPVYSLLFNPSYHSGAQQMPTILTPSTSQQSANSLQQPLENISYSSLTNVALFHPLSHTPSHIFPPPHSHSQFNPVITQAQPPPGPPWSSPQSNLQHNNSTTIPHPFHLYYTQYPGPPYLL